MSVFEDAKRYGSPNVMVTINANGSLETIVVGSESFDKKIAFYQKAYNDLKGELRHVMNSGVRIVDVRRGKVTYNYDK